MILTILIFIIILGLLVFVHEFGHFWVAKRSGMKVSEFGFGFPPRCIGIQKMAGRWKIIWGRQRVISNIDGDATGRAQNDSTIYSINWIPVGGFVKILGENNEHEEHPQSFINKGFWPRFFTLVAGVAMNVVLAWVLISIGFGLGLPSIYNSMNDLPKGGTLKDPQVAIVDVKEGLPAANVGIQPGDIIVSIDSLQVTELEQVSDYIKTNQGKEFDFEIKRINQTLDFRVGSLAEPAQGQGPTGIALANVGLLSFPWHQSIWEGAKATVYSLQTIVTGVYKIIATGVGLESLGGPVKIAQLTGQVTDLGFIYILQFTAFLSLNLAILNILPFPALDGGRVIFLIVEKIRGKRNNQKVEQLVNTLGFVFLLLLMVLVTIKDIKAF